jgi:REP element-mobilizing transposase RayT
MKDFREKNHRLDPSLYRGNVAVAFTCCEHYRKRMFKEEPLTRHFMMTLEQECARFSCDLIVYVFMPDHAHMLVAGRDPSADTLKAMTHFQQKTGYWLSKNSPHFQWQKDYYEHILRTWERAEAEIKKQVRYILENPMRKGIVSHWKAYPFKGSTLYTLDEWDD